MSYSSEKVKRWRENTKRRMVEAMGGKCSMPHCGYDKCIKALDFHHLDMRGKDFSFGSIRASPKSWASIVDELKKCVLLCANCHREVHAGLVTVPINAPTFNTEFENYKILERAAYMEPCPVCSTPKPKSNKTCSLVCAGTLSRKVDWDKYDLLVLEQTMSKVAIADMLGVSDMAVRKRLKKLKALLTSVPS